MNARTPFASVQFGAVAQAWWLLPEKTRTFIVDSIDKATNEMLAARKDEIRLLEEAAAKTPTLSPRE